MENIDSLKVKSEYPLTSYQKDIWVDQKMNIKSPLYNIGMNVEIIGKFDFTRLNNAINNIISKNDAFRLEIRENNGEPYQYIIPERNYSLPYYDFSKRNMSKDDIKDWAQDRFEKIFEFEDLLFDFALIKCSDEVHYFFIKSHHIIADGWALTLISHKIVDEYNNFVDSIHESSFVTFIDKDKEYLLSNKYQKDIDFWKDEFKSIPEPLYSYKNKKKHSKKTSKRYKHIIPRPKYNEIIKLCTDNNFTEFHYFLGVFSTYFCRIHNRDEIVIGVPMLNRSRKEMDIIGHCVNAIPLKINVNNSDSFIDLVKNIKLTFSKCYRHHKLSFGEIYRLLNLGDTNLFDLSLSFDMHNTQFHFKNTQSVTEVLSHQNESKALFALIHAAEVNDDAILFLDYLLEIFNNSFSIDRVATHLDVIIDQTLENSNIKVKDIDIINNDEKNLLLNVFNKTESDFPANKTIIQVFEDQVVKTPNNTAVIFEDVELTYNELNEKANNVGHYLREKYKIVPNDFVAVMLSRSENMIISLLGILKSGAAYVPIDPAYPLERINYMVKDSKPKVIISDRSIENDGFNETINIEDIFNLDAIKENPIHTAKTEDLAYVIYTSGSTGRPKGTLLKNSGLINMSLDQIKRFGITDDDNVIQCASTSFDASLYEIFMALFSGSTLVVTSEEVKNDINKIHREIINKKVTVAAIPPSFLKNLHINIMKRLRVIITGGEKPIISYIKDLYKDLKYVNTYGPTEASVSVTAFSVDSNSSLSEETSIPIGEPISNTKLYILDKNSNPMPIGIGGELCISGVGLAKGYLNQPELTAEKFIENPFIPGERMYKSGDHARWLPDGNIEFLGRIDNQVKIRGFRIELDEIEKSLINHREVINTVVTVKEKENGEKILVSYYISKREIEVSEIRNFLGNSLPDYMIPSHFIHMDVFPLTTNGKIDKKALPEPGGIINSGVDYIGPKNETQEKLILELQDILGLEKIGIFDNFYEIGADSLDLLRFVQRSQSHFDIEFSDVLQNLSIAEIAKIVKPKINQSIISRLQELKENIDNKDDNHENKNLNELVKYTNRFKKDYANIDLNKTMNYSTILLTGSTGYLGIHILRELLLKGNSKLYLIIRGISDSHAFERLTEKYMYYFNEDINHYNDRIHLISGDLTKNNLGLLDEEYDEIASKVQCIINSAAVVSHYGSYESFYTSNVYSVKNLLSLCEKGCNKYYVHISTTSVGCGLEIDDSSLFTEYHEEIGLNSTNIYVRSKIEAENKVFDARKKGVNSTILRVGNLVFQSSTGKCQQNIDSNAFYQILKAFFNIKMMPNILRNDIELSYIDYVSRAVVLLFDKTDLCNEVFHIYNHNTLNYPEFSNLIRRSGYEITLHDIHKLCDYLIELYEDPNFKETIEILLIHSHGLESSKENQFTITSDKTMYILEKLGFKWDKVELEHIEKMIKYGIEIGFFERQLIEVK